MVKIEELAGAVCAHRVLSEKVQSGNAVVMKDEQLEEVG